MPFRSGNNLHHFFTIVFAAAALLASSICAAPLIAPERIFPEAWQNAGYPGEIPSPKTIVNVTSFGALGNGSNDDRNAVQNAINSLGGAPGVVYFPAGTYLLGSRVDLSSGVVIRGESAQSVTLRWNHIGDYYTGTGLYIGASQSGSYQTVVSGYTIHSSSIVVTNGSSFASGDYAEIRQDNLPAWNLSSWAGKASGQILRITAVSGNTLTLERPLRLTYAAAQNPEIRKITPITNCGVENIKVERLNAGTATSRNNIATIFFDGASRCWVRGVESNFGFGGHIAFSGCTQCEVTGCYIHHASDYDGGGSGYGIRIESKTGECLIEDNIFRSLRHAMLFQAGPNGNVVAYNYSIESKDQYGFSTSDVTLHGNYSYANLVEGNICRFISIDESGHGANGPLNTVFRNRTEASGISIANNGSNNQNIVGNEITSGSYSMGSIGHFLYGNNRPSGGMFPDPTTSLTDYSYYLNSDPTISPALPAFWNIASAYPSIGIPLTLATVKENPAKTRYTNGAISGYTVTRPADTDGDGQPDAVEAVFGTDPNNASSTHRATTVRNGSNQPVISWPSVNGRNYRIEYSDSLAGTWQALGTTTAPGVSANFTDTSALPTRRFYRILAL